MSLFLFISFYDKVVLQVFPSQNHNENFYGYGSRILQIHGSNDNIFMSQNQCVNDSGACLMNTSNTHMYYATDKKKKKVDSLRRELKNVVILVPTLSERAKYVTENRCVV